MFVRQRRQRWYGKIPGRRESKPTTSYLLGFVLYCTEKKKCCESFPVQECGQPGKKQRSIFDIRVMCYISKRAMCHLLRQYMLRTSTLRRQQRESILAYVALRAFDTKKYIMRIQPSLVDFRHGGSLLSPAVAPMVVVDQPHRSVAHTFLRRQ